jgi:hypothetical protein
MNSRGTVKNSITNLFFLFLLLVGIGLVFQAINIRDIKAACYPDQICTGFGNYCVHDPTLSFCGGTVCTGCYPPPCYCLNAKRAM